MARRRRSISSLVALVAALACSSIIGCATQTAGPVHAPPPPRALRITAQRNQSQRQQDGDKADCQSIASGQATSSDSWARVFTACMGGRGYMVERQAIVWRKGVHRVLHGAAGPSSSAL